MSKIRPKIGLFSLTIVLIGLTSCSHSKKEEKVSSLKVTTETAKRSMNETGPIYVGQVEEQSATAVSFTSMGTLNRVFVSEGQWVKRGQLIATIDPTSAQSALASAKAQRCTGTHEDAP